MTQRRAGRGPSRAAVREGQLRRARSIELPASCDVAVVGGGASGLCAAIAAAEAGASVVVLERDLECGRTILATGNGRCNFSTVELGADRYNDPTFVSPALGETPLDDILAFFRESGLRWSLEGPRLYPVSRQAASVRNVLLRRARRAGVTLAPARTVVSLEPGSDGFSLALSTEGEESVSGLLADSVVLATGGGALDLPRHLGLEVTPTSRALCPVDCEDSPVLGLDGRRDQAAVSLIHGHFPCWRERGEVLFRDYGLSGIVVFDLYRRVQPGDVVTIDLAPDVARSELQELVDPFARGTFEEGCLDGVLDPSIARLLERLARERWDGGIELPGREDPPRSDSEALMRLVSGLPLRVTGVHQGGPAQVTRGGVATSQVDPHTMGVRGMRGLFACGEALDVDGDCGGYNLSWAWKSGLVAGSNAAERTR